MRGGKDANLVAKAPEGAQERIPLNNPVYTLQMAEHVPSEGTIWSVSSSRPPAPDMPTSLTGP